MLSRCFIGVQLLCAFFTFAQSEKVKTLEAKADTLLNHQEYAAALELYQAIFKKAKEKDKFYFGILYKSAVCNYSLGRYEAALSQLEEFVPAYPEFPQGHLLKAFVLRELDDTDGQLEALDKAIELQGANPDFMKWRAMLLLQKEEYEGALRELQQLRGLQPDAEVETYIAIAQHNQGQPDSALLSLNRAIELDATYQPAYLYASSFCLQSGENELGLTYLNLLLRLDPKNTTALFYKGIALVEMEKLDEGCSCLLKAFYNGKDEAGDYLKQYCYGAED
jgi:tetratricopeptide (TPR) repeat protein